MAKSKKLLSVLLSVALLISSIFVGGVVSANTGLNLYTTTNTYDDDNIPNVDLPKNKNTENVEPLPESTRPRKDGPGGENGD